MKKYFPLILAILVLNLVFVSNAQSAGTVCYAKNCFPYLNYSRQSIPKRDRYKNPFTAPDFPRSQNPNQYLPPKRLVDLSALTRNVPLTQFTNIFEILKPGRYKSAFFSSPVLNIIDAMISQIPDRVRITSAYRSPSQNAALIDASPWSRHMYGDAIDFTASKLNMAELKVHCERAGASFIQLYDDHIHCDWRKQPLDPQFHGSHSPTVTLNEVVRTMSQESDIKVVNLGSHWMLRVIHPPKEDEGSLSYNWDITDDLRFHYTTNNKYVLLKKTPRKFRASVVVGGFYRVSRYFDLQ
jgi:hypothetical protein